MAKASKVNTKINKAIEALDKRFGERVLMKMDEANADVDVIPSGRDGLDVALGGGYGVGKIIEIFAESAAGKTGLALEVIAEVQKTGGIVAFIDAEHALNTEYCEEVGVDINSLYISQPSYGEQAFEAIRALINTGEVELIVVDSVSAMVPKAELEGESGQANIALQARMMSQGMKLITGPAAEVGCTVVFINQLRASIGMYQPPTVTSGGKALKFYASQRLEIKNKGKIKEGDVVIGFKQFITVVKNKIGTPFRTFTNDIIYGKGSDNFIGTIEALVEKKILEKKGGWYAYNGSNLANGIKKLRLLMEDSPSLLEELRDKLKNEK